MKKIKWKIAAFVAWVGRKRQTITLTTKQQDYERKRDYGRRYYLHAQRH